MADTRETIRIAVPPKGQYIIDTLTRAGHEAYVVGGCVRDSILGRTPEDWDITTSAQPEQVKELFPRTVDTGLQHGTVTVMLDREGFEVTTYRVDGEYEDSRHPREVTFTSSLEEDLRRRDLTINAMAYNEREGLVDLFGGLGDLNAGVVRCVGNPEERFREDALRILRAIRFCAQLGYTVEDGTLEAVRKMAHTLSRISAERIQTELVKLLVSPHPDYLRLAYDTGVTSVFLPGTHSPIPESGGGGQGATPLHAAPRHWEARCPGGGRGGHHAFSRPRHSQRGNGGEDFAQT